MRSKSKLISDQQMKEKLMKKRPIFELSALKIDYLLQIFYHTKLVTLISFSELPIIYKIH